MKGQLLCRVALVAVFLVGLSALSFGQISGEVSFGDVGIGINVGVGVEPPPLPVYDQPTVPAPGYLWTPGYWSWDDDAGYYWVPGTWVQPPQVGMVWTPGYWGWDDADQTYAWNDGYWDNQVGYYGGIDYGYGYPGDGYYGGRWQGNQFYYNNTVNNVNNVVTTVYSSPVPQTAATAAHVSYNGGPGGTQARPSPQQVQARQTAKVKITPAQKQHVLAAKANPATHVRNNGGKPQVAATAKPGDFNHAVQAKAPGGHVDPKVLQANAKTTKVNHNPPHHEAAKGASPAAASKPAENSKSGDSAAARNERNTAKPTGTGAESGTHARATEPSTPKPENSRHEAGTAAGMPQSEGAGHRTAEPASKSQEPKAQPAEHPATKEKSAEPARGNEKPEKAKPANEKDKPEEPK